MWRGLGGNWGKGVSAMRDSCVEAWALNSVMKHSCWCTDCMLGGNDGWMNCRKRLGYRQSFENVTLQAKRMN